MKEVISGILTIFGMFILIQSLFVLPIGVFETKSDMCTKYPINRFSLMLPMFKVGCWLGEPYEKK